MSTTAMLLELAAAQPSSVASPPPRRQHTAAEFKALQEELKQKRILAYAKKANAKKIDATCYIAMAVKFMDDNNCTREEAELVMNTFKESIASNGDNKCTREEAEFIMNKVMESIASNNPRSDREQHHTNTGPTSNKHPLQMSSSAQPRRVNEKHPSVIRTRARIAAMQQAKCLRSNPPGPSNQPLQVSPAQGGAQLFLSYRVPETGSKEQGGDCTVPQLKSALEAQGYSVFVGESDIEGGASWAQAIKVAITDCQVFIPVCSKTYGDTKWTFRELHEADEANKEILPLWHSGDYPPKPVSMYLGHVQRLPRGNQPLVQADFQSLVSDLVAAVKKAGCLPRNPPGPSN